MPTPPRKSQLKKAPQSNLVDALTTTVALSASAEPAQGEPSAPVSQPAQMESADVNTSHDRDEPRRPGPGRPRGKRRMEPLSSKIEITLRDQMDVYLDANEMTVVDFLDAAIRNQLNR